MQFSRSTFLLMICLLLALSACARDGDTTETGTPESTAESASVPEIKLPKVNLPADAVATAQAALQQAGELAGTAVQQAGETSGTLVQRAEEAAGTAAVVATQQGGAALATVEAINTPDLTELTERLAAARPDENGNLSVTLNEAELNQLLNLRYLVMSAEPELRDATVRLADGAIELDGTVPLLLPVNVRLTLRPVVTDGRLDLEIVDVALGRLRAPEVVRRFAGQLIGDTLSEVTRRLPDGFQLQSIVIEEGSLTISGRIANTSGE